MRDPVQFRLPQNMRVVAQEIARERDITIGQLIRDLLGKEISRYKNARPPNRADEQLAASLRARLAPVIAAATDWTVLQTDLASLGFEFRPAGGGLALYSKCPEERLCKASELGFSYSRLVERFGEGFPGHAHTWVLERFQQFSGETNDVLETD